MRSTSKGSFVQKIFYRKTPVRTREAPVRNGGQDQLIIVTGGPRRTLRVGAGEVHAQEGFDLEFPSIANGSEGIKKEEGRRTTKSLKKNLQRGSQSFSVGGEERNGSGPEQKEIREGTGRCTREGYLGKRGLARKVKKNEHVSKGGEIRRPGGRRQRGVEF